jgi:Glycosyl hydrolases family 2, sugar binding domain/Glycosyl hydrolases family 2, TIM barrel domain/Glycosyl hydrolases family 2
MAARVMRELALKADARIDGGSREEISLDGHWDIRFGDETDWRAVEVPGPWQASHPDRAWQAGTVVYRRDFRLPAKWNGREIALRFGAVSYHCAVTVNERLLGQHEGSYLPFEFVLPEAVLRDQNKLEVRVTLPSGDESLYPDYPFGEIPHGKQSWYGPLGGIWQSVRLEARSAEHLTHCAIAPDANSGVVALTLACAGSDDVNAEVTIFGAHEVPVARSVVAIRQGKAQVAMPIRLHVLWSPDNPYLYSARVDLVRSGAIADRSHHSFGFRSIETRDGTILLNGKPIYLRGALDQDYYPEGICTPPSLEFLEDQARKAKALGLNLLRCHIKAPDPRYYEVADRLGLLVWTEIPNVQEFSAKSAERLRDTMQGILDRDGNSPSIIAWTIVNEDWGTRLVENAAHRSWLKQTYDWLKAQDPSRLVVDNSACFPNFHVKTDLNDYHYYRSVPERRGEWEALNADFASGPSWTYSPHGDAERSGDEPLVISEFGVWGLPHPDAIAMDSDKEPFWAESGGNWANGAAYPHGIKQRFAELGLSKVFGSFGAFIQAAQWYQFANLKYEIETIRAHPSIMGYVITELTDVHWEANGLMDINRNPRVFHERFPEINADLVIVPRIDRYAGYAGDVFKIGLRIATGAGSIPHGTSLRWRIDDASGGAIIVPATGPVCAPEIGPLELKLPETDVSRIVTVSFVLTSSGATIARNSVDIAVYPRRSTRDLPTVASDDGALAAYAAALGYQVGDAAAADVILSRGLDEAAIEALNAGARYVVLADSPVGVDGNLRRDTPSGDAAARASLTEAVPRDAAWSLPNIVLHPRTGSIWRGDWVAGFSWVRREGPFANLPGGPLLDLSFDRVVPHHVMTGFRSWEFDGLVHAGIVVGWVHMPAALIAERKIGKGQLVATTFRLTGDPPGVDPVAAALFDAIIATAARAAERRRD